MPSSRDAEVAIIGAILLDNAAYLTAIDLEAEDFYWDSHRILYRRITDLLAAERPVDFVTLTEELQRHDELAAIGGSAYLTSLTDGLPRVKNIKQYVRIVKDKAKLRDLINTATSVIESAYEGSGPADQIIAAAESRIAKVAGSTEIESSAPIFVSAADFTHNTPREINWMIEGVIEVGANGLIVATPKTGKSIAVLDMAVALAAGQSWMPGKMTGAGFYVPKPVKVGMCAREDNPGTTKWRLKHIAAARQVHIEELSENLWLNSKAETPRLMIDEPGDMRQLIAGIEKRRIEFLILDVFRRIHSADENDPNEMQHIIDVVCDIQAKTGAQVCLVHHKRKESGDRGVVSSLTDSARGSSVIAGYAEWICGLKVVNPEAAKHEWVREVEVELKAAIAPDRWYCQFIDQPGENAGISVERVFWSPPKKGKKKADSYAAGQPEQQHLKGAQDDSDEGVPF